jgi:hypothetical protein
MGMLAEINTYYVPTVIFVRVLRAVKYTAQLYTQRVVESLFVITFKVHCYR